MLSFFFFFFFFTGCVKADFSLTFKILTTAINPLQIHLRSCPRLSSKPLIFTTVPPPQADTHLYLYIYTHTHAEYSSTSEPGGNVIPLYKKKYGLAGKSLYPVFYWWLGSGGRGWGSGGGGPHSRRESHENVADQWQHSKSLY